MAYTIRARPMRPVVSSNIAAKQIGKHVPGPLTKINCGRADATMETACQNATAVVNNCADATSERAAFSIVNFAHGC